MNDWGLYGRTYEMIARNMTTIPEVGRVVCILPPKMIWDGYYTLPFQLKKESEKLYLLTPNFRMVPKYILSEAMWNSINVHFRDKLINKTLNLIGFSKENTVMWLFPPHRYIENILDSIPYKMLITQIIDNHTYKANESDKMKAFAEKQYTDLSRRSNVVFISSPQNLEYFSSVNRNCHFIENAVDEMFINSPSEMPCRKGGSRPRLGYVGWITQRTDLKLLAFIAKERPGYDLVIAGPQELGIDLRESGLMQFPNVHIENAIPYKTVPRFLENIDVCLIPHRDTLYSRSMNPLKAFQYLGSGRPVVSTPIAGVERWDGMISVGESYREFVEKIDDAIRKDGPADALRRINAVREDTWGARVNQIHRIITNHI
jgi:hypothetical protein